MKRVLLSAVAAATVLMTSHALAADMPVRRPASVQRAAYYNWSGCFIGAHAGGAWGETRYTDTADGFDLGTQKPNGFIGGGQVGCDIQSGMAVFGIEADASWSNIKDSFQTNVLADDVITSKTEWLGTIAGRLGYADDWVMVYVKGGVAFARNTYSEDCCDGIGLDQQPVFPVYTGSRTRWGWMVGAGIEVSLAANWSAKVEYNYIDFGSEDTDLVTSANAIDKTFTYDIEQRIHVVKFGVNYRFSAGAVAAKD